jgi:hypothetical protein
MSEMFSGPKYTAWKEAVAEAMAAGLDRTAAIRKVDRDQPGLRQAMLAEVNASRA